MKKKKRRIVSWFLTLAMIFSILPTAAYADEFVWPSELTAAETDWEITGTVTPTSTITVGSGQTLTVHGSGTISDFDATIFVVENGGHLVLDKVTITGNTVGEDGAVFVKKGGLLDLGYNEIKERTAPGISGNTIENNEKNLVVAEGARVRLNAEATQTIGVSYEKALETPEAVIEGGRYTILGTEST